ncbi:hypothetical protein GH714_022191 [Hevea brasiliensis]|uniref:NADH dehydrogenase [ubiquinone] 1 alpha subcomplex subunit 13 n=1 Tax=Hevea brasiliensis TaxID=3981 RepID=A0A6A6MPB7_HEVBR|nr:hypothetical protein GH714_022191 [Hevea brasiliensis]
MTEAVIRKKPGMASVKDMPILQDGPPPGGFPPVRYARRIPTRTQRHGHLPCCFWRFLLWDVSSGSRQQDSQVFVLKYLLPWALKEEKYAARRAILPVLQAEEDERVEEVLQYEAEVMKDVPGWKVGENVYNSGKWMPPATGELRPDVW